jgi:hypothetical protein
MIKVPSVTEFHITKKGNRIPKASENIEDLKILDQLLGDSETNIRSCYSRERSESDESTLDISIKGGVRQRYNPNYFFINDFMKAISYSDPPRSLDDIYEEICKFPCNPEANIFLAARLAIDYYTSQDRTSIDNYLISCECSDMLSYPIEIYPVYYLFFFLTRFYTYPFNLFQMNCLQKRPLRRAFIDSIFDMSDLNSKILAYSNKYYQQVFETDFKDWDRWTSEYFNFYMTNSEKLRLDLDQVYTQDELFKILSTWTDNDLLKLGTELNFTLPTRDHNPYRSSWIDTIVAVIATSNLVKMMIGKPEPVLRVFGNNHIAILSV